MKKVSMGMSPGRVAEEFPIIALRRGNRPQQRGTHSEPVIAVVARDATGVFLATNTTRYDFSRGVRSTICRDPQKIAAAIVEWGPRLPAVHYLAEKEPLTNLGEGYVLSVEDTGRTLGGESIDADQKVFLVLLLKDDSVIFRQEGYPGIVWAALMAKARHQYEF